MQRFKAAKWAVFAPVDESVKEEFFRAVAADNGGEVSRLLEFFPQLMDARNGLDQTGLIYAAAIGCEGAFFAVLEKGPNASAKDKYGATALNHVNEAGLFLCRKALIEYIDAPLQKVSSYSCALPEPVPPAALPSNQTVASPCPA